MSFFNDFLDYFNISDFNSESSISIIVGVGLLVVGKIKIINFSEEKIEVFVNKKKVCLIGECLKISAISKGEMIVEGNVFNVNMEKWKWIGSV